MNNQMLIILGLLSVKHFLADFPLQTPYMLGKGKKGLAFILPLATHCAVHALLTFAIISSVNKDLIWLAGVEFGVHFIIDRLKCLYKLPTGTWEAEQKGKYLSRYYIAFGLDQLAHQLTYLWIVYMLFQ